MSDIAERLRSPEVFIMDGAMVSPVAYMGASEIDRLTARVAELEAALKPFAKAGELFDPRPEGYYDICIYNPAAGKEYSLCGDDLRRARAALAKKTPDAL